MENLPVFDFHNPWVALIQIALLFILPTLVGLVTDKLTDSKTKALLLGLLTLISTALVWLLDVAIAGAWGEADWTGLLNVVISAAITWALANGIFKGVLVPTGVIEKAQDSNVIQFVDRGKSEAVAAAAAASPRGRKTA